MDAMGDPRVSRIVIYKAAQTGCTEVLNNVVGFHMDQDPTTILVIQPTQDMASTWSKSRLGPMIRDTPVLAGKVRDANRRDSGNTVFEKIFPGGRVSVIGSNAPAGLASRPIRIVLADEVDRYPPSAGEEGDPLTLAAARQTTFWNKKTIIGSTPTIKGASVIEREWLKSNQCHYYVPCHACKYMQVMNWAQVSWDKQGEGADKVHLPDTAHYVCEHCGEAWNDVDRWNSIVEGEWRAHQPEVVDIIGFSIPGFLSSWLTFGEIAQKFLDAKDDPRQLQVFINTVLGEVWEDKGETVEASPLLERRENYGVDCLPDGIRVVVAGVDTQGDRLEVATYGYGYKEECWAIEYNILIGDPAQQAVWNELDQLLLKKYKTESGRELRVAAACVDSGGAHQNAVLSFCRPRTKRRIYAIRGIDGPRPVWPKRASRTKKTHDVIWNIGVSTGKDATYGRLRIVDEGPGYIHFPVGEDFDAEFFKQLTSERVLTRYRMGRPVRIWDLPKGRRNEGLDTFVYALAARMSLNVKLDVPHAKPAPKPTTTMPVRKNVNVSPVGYERTQLTQTMIAAGASKRSIARKLARA